jgi:hypothetical protein
MLAAVRTAAGGRTRSSGPGFAARAVRRRPAGAAISMYRGLRAAVDGDVTGAMERYQEAAATMTRLGLARAGAGVFLFGRFAVLVTRDRAGEMTADLERVYNIPGLGAAVGEPYAIALAAAGRTAEARAAAGPPQPLSRDVLWLFLTGVRGLAAVALMTGRGPSPLTRTCCPTRTARPAPTTLCSRSGRPPGSSATSPATSAGPARGRTTSRRSRWPSGPGWRCGGKPHCGGWMIKNECAARDSNPEPAD